MGVPPALPAPGALATTSDYERKYVMTDRDLTPDPLETPRYGVPMAGSMGLFHGPGWPAPGQYAGFEVDESSVDTPRSNPWLLFAVPLFVVLCVVLAVVVA